MAEGIISDKQVLKKILTTNKNEYKPQGFFKDFEPHRNGIGQHVCVEGI
jgi:hypothetical protein